MGSDSNYITQKYIVTILKLNLKRRDEGISL